MASEPRISNPVRLDPWHNIVDCQFDTLDLYAIATFHFAWYVDATDSPVCSPFEPMPPGVEIASAGWCTTALLRPSKFYAATGGVVSLMVSENILAGGTAFGIPTDTTKGLSEWQCVSGDNNANYSDLFLTESQTYCQTTVPPYEGPDIHPDLWDSSFQTLGALNSTWYFETPKVNGPIYCGHPDFGFGYRQTKGFDLLGTENYPTAEGHRDTVCSASMDFSGFYIIAESGARYNAVATVINTTQNGGNKLIAVICRKVPE